MRAEKKYLVDEVKGHLGKSQYVYLTDYARMSVPDTAVLRDELVKCGAEFHVVKNSVLKHAAAECEMPELGTLEGQTAIVVGGDSPSEVAKVLIKFHKDKDEKCEVRIGVMGDAVMSREEVQQLSKLPSLEVLRAQLLGLLNTPAQQILRVMQAVPEGVLNVLQAKADKGDV